MKKWLVFLLGVVVGVILTIFVSGIVARSDSDDVTYLEQPVSYENKTETSFKVFQVIGKKAALANEISEPKYKWYNGNTVVILGENFYSDQIVNMKNPQRVGTYSYTTRADMPMTVPVIKGKIE